MQTTSTHSARIIHLSQLPAEHTVGESLQGIPAFKEAALQLYTKLQDWASALLPLEQVITLDYPTERTLTHFINEACRHLGLDPDSPTGLELNDNPSFAYAHDLGTDRRLQQVNRCIRMWKMKYGTPKQGKAVHAGPGWVAYLHTWGAQDPQVVVYLPLTTPNAMQTLLVEPCPYPHNTYLSQEELNLIRTEALTYLDKNGGMVKIDYYGPRKPDPSWTAFLGDTVTTAPSREEIEGPEFH